MAHEAQKHDQAPGKKVYETPHLEILGSMEKSTQGPLGGTIDGIFGGIGGFTPPPGPPPS